MDEQERRELYSLRQAVRFLARKIDQINNTTVKPNNTSDETEKLLAHD